MKGLISKRLYQSCRNENENENYFANNFNPESHMLFLSEREREKEPPKIFTNYPDIVSK